jgi:hypothetical protein
MGSFGQSVVKQGAAVPADFCISQAEMKLYRMINDYRKRYNLAAVPLSRSLSFVAILHVKDLFINMPDKAPCNFHSWSDKGSWKPFCYPTDENKKNSVWDKPRELTRYPGKGYEIIYWESNPAGIDSIMSFWKSESYFNNFLLNTGKWQDKKWSAMGVGIYENYACVWFGEATDPEGKVVVCGSAPVNPSPQADTLPQVKQDKKVKPGKKPAIIADTSMTSKPAIKIEPSESGSGLYYIIIKSNLPMESATRMIPKLITDGYPAARVLEKDGKARISVFESPNKTETMARLKEIKRKYKDAWLLKN